MLVSVLCAAALLLATVFLHSTRLSFLRAHMFDPARTKRSGITLAVWCVIGLHIAEIALYAVVLWFLNDIVDAGDFSGNREFSPIDYFYYAA